MSDVEMASPESATDPVCGMTVDAASSNHRIEYEGVVFAFCCARCLERFAAEPARYLEARETEARHHPLALGGSSSAEAPYICPMCPGVESELPAHCPKCGMALEPAIVVPATATRYVASATKCLATICQIMPS